MLDHLGNKCSARICEEMKPMSEPLGPKKRVTLANRATIFDQLASNKKGANRRRPMCVGEQM